MIFKWGVNLLSYAGIVIDFLFIMHVYLSVMDWLTASGFLLFGVLFFWFTFLKETKRFWGVKAALVAWSLHVYAVFVISGTVSLQHSNAFPSDFKGTAPFIYGLTPLLILWGLRFTLSAIQNS